MDQNQDSPNREEHLFDDQSYTLEQAGSGKRLANYFIDYIVFIVFLSLLSFVLEEVKPGITILIYGDDDGLNIRGRLTGLMLYAMFMGLEEAIFKGRSIGKFITGTVAVNADGSRVSGQTALLRGLIRAVPFNAFSALGSPPYPWHDRWSKTFVVNFKDLRED